MDQIQQLLKKHKLRSTPFRQSVLGIFTEASPVALSKNDVEQSLNERTKVDRVTLYRTLKSFEDAGLIHVAMDNSEQQKYGLCSDACDTHHHQCAHAHFHCTNCNETICLEEVTIPQVKIPKNYQLQDTQLVLSGVCQNCN